MIRMFACKGADANMEVYISQSVALDGPALARSLAQPVIGYYTLDLTEANKGKVLEPVKVSMSADGKTVIINQYTRRLPPTRIPMDGGTWTSINALARAPNAVLSKRRTKAR